MAGIFSREPKVISARNHALIDYISAGVHFAAAAVFWKRNRRAAAGALALGGAVLANSLMTDYPLGVFRRYSFKVHGLVDYGIAAITSAMPEMVGNPRGAAPSRFFRVQGIREVGVAAITDYNDDSGARRTSNRLPRWLERAA